MRKKISVVIPTHNRAPLLMNCIYALTRQSFKKKDFEIIIVTDGPDKATCNMLSRLASITFLPEIRCLSLSKKSGPAAARNLGWRMAEAPLVAFTDDDCIPDEDWLARYYEAYEQAGSELIVFKGKVVVPLSDEPTDYEKNAANLATADFVTANCACTKEALQLIGGFDEDYTMAWREDSDLEFAFLQAGIGIVKVKQASIVHPVRRMRWGVSIREQKKSMFNALLFKKYPSLYRRKIRNSALWNYYAMIGSFIATPVLFLCGLKWLALAAFVSWLFMVIAFTAKRLKNTSHSPAHVVEMFITSMLIPFLSVYWTLYGSYRFKVWFI
jgi:GT2 family glycosyltransferase